MLEASDESVVDGQKKQCMENIKPEWTLEARLAQAAPTLDMW